MSVYKRNDSPYYWMSLPVVDDNGNIVRYHKQSTKRRMKSEALSVFRQLNKQKLDEVQLKNYKSMTIAGAARQYIEDTKALGKSASKDYQVYLNKLNNNDGDQPISRLNRMWLLTLKNKRLFDGLKHSTINNEITFWISVYNKARNDYNCNVPNENFKDLKLFVEQKTRYLLEGEEEKLLSKLPEGDSKDLVVFLIDTGARYNEIASLPWNSVDKEFQWINLYRSKVANEGIIYCTDRVQKLLSKRFTLNHNRQHDFVFPSRTIGNPRGYSTRVIKNAIEASRLNEKTLVDRYGKFTCHSFRHTFASRLVQGGMSLYSVSKLLGHKNEQMSQRYAHLVPSVESRKATEILNKRSANVSRNNG